MSKLQCRGSIALVAVAAALLCSRPAEAQVGHGPGYGHGGLFGNAGTGFPFEVVDQAKAERRLEHVEAKLSRDAERGNAEAVDRDSRRIHRLRYRIAVDDWLTRKNQNCDTGPFPYPFRIDPMSC